MNNLETPQPGEFDPTGEEHVANNLAQLDELMDMLKHMEDESNIDLRNKRKMYETPLPPLFHATTAEGAKAIARDGLMSSELMFDNSEVVSLSDTVKFALDCAAETRQMPREQLVVLEITTRGQDRDLFKSFLKFTVRDYEKLAGLPPSGLPDGPIHEVHFEGADGISPDFIYQLTPQEAADFSVRESS